MMLSLCAGCENGNTGSATDEKQTEEKLTEQQKEASEITNISPIDSITKTGETRTIDSVKMEFQLTPGTEAPAEMNTWFPEKKALWLAENCTGTLHNSPGSAGS